MQLHYNKDVCNRDSKALGIDLKTWEALIQNNHDGD
jgi:hypothetical protein